MDRELYESKGGCREGGYPILLPRGDDWAMARGEIPTWLEFEISLWGWREFANYLRGSTMEDLGFLSYLLMKFEKMHQASQTLAVLCPLAPPPLANERPNERTD